MFAWWFGKTLKRMQVTKNVIKNPTACFYTLFI